MSIIARNLKFHDWFVVLRIGISGGFLIDWHNNIKVKCIAEFFDIFFFEIHDCFNNIWNVVFMHGSLNAQGKKFQ